MRLTESAAPDGPLETVVPSCLHGRVSSPHREETPTEESVDPGLLIWGPGTYQLETRDFRQQTSGSTTTLGCDPRKRTIEAARPIVPPITAADSARGTHVLTSRPNYRPGVGCGRLAAAHSTSKTGGREGNPSNKRPQHVNYFPLAPST